MVALSTRAVFEEILDNDEAFQLFCSIAASGEAQGGWENSRIAALVPPAYQDLAPKITRHGADEDKHGRIFTALLRQRGLSTVPVPRETDYTMLLEERGFGVAHAELRDNQPLSEQNIITYLAHSRVTEQRAAEQMRTLRRYTTGRPEFARAIRMISDDEDNHLAYCHEELLRLRGSGHAELIEHTLRATAKAEIAVYRTVSVAVMAHMGRLLHWPRWKSTLLLTGVTAIYVYERLFGWRRMTTLRTPAHANPLSDRAPAARSMTHHRQPISNRPRRRGRPAHIQCHGAGHRSGTVAARGPGAAIRAEFPIAVGDPADANRRAEWRNEIDPVPDLPVMSTMWACHSYREGKVARAIAATTIVMMGPTWCDSLPSATGEDLSRSRPVGLDR